MKNRYIREREFYRFKNGTIGRILSIYYIHGEFHARMRKISTQGYTYQCIVTVDNLKKKATRIGTAEILLKL